LTVNGAATAEHFIGAGSTPTVAAGEGMGYGGGLAISISGTDASMEVTLTTGSSGLVGGVAMFTVTFANAFTTAPSPTFSPGNSPSAAVLQTNRIYITATTTGLTLWVGLNFIATNTTYTYNIKT
jgi:hypothetical protein